MTVSQSEWEIRLKQLYAEAEAIRETGLWHNIMAHCEATARTLRTQAGAAATDRDMNRLHGKADAYAEMLMVMNDVVAAHANSLRQRMEDDAIEEGRSGTDGVGREVDRLPGEAKFPDRKRTTFARVRDEED